MSPDPWAEQSDEDGYGVSCTDACATPATGGCDESGMGELDSEAGFKLAKPDAMSCSSYSSISGSLAPYKWSGGSCYFGTSGTCDTSVSFARRLCACKCGAGSSQPLPAIARSCQT